MDNKEQIKDLLYFDHDFYHKVTICFRKGEGKGIGVHKIIHVGSWDSLGKEWDNIKNIASELGARVYVDLVPYRIHIDFLRNIYPKCDNVIGAKDPLNLNIPQPDHYCLYDADKGHELETNNFLNHLNELSIPYYEFSSSEYGKHIVFKRSYIEKIDKIYKNKIHLDRVNLCIYNPHC